MFLNIFVCPQSSVLSVSVGKGSLEPSPDLYLSNPQVWAPPRPELWFCPEENERHRQVKLWYENTNTTNQNNQNMYYYSIHKMVLNLMNRVIKHISSFMVPCIHWHCSGGSFDLRPFRRVLVILQGCRFLHLPPSGVGESGAGESPRGAERRGGCQHHVSDSFAWRDTPLLYIVWRPVTYELSTLQQEIQSLILWIFNQDWT